METNQTVIAERLEALQARMATLDAAAEQYQLMLLLCQERLQKLPQLERIMAWLDEQAAVFGDEDYGATVREVRQRRSRKTNFERGLAPHQLVRSLRQHICFFCFLFCGVLVFSAHHCQMVGFARVGCGLFPLSRLSRAWSPTKT